MRLHNMGNHLGIIIFLQCSMFILSLKWFKFAQHKHEPNVKAVRVNGQITEVKQL